MQSKSCLLSNERLEHAVDATTGDARDCALSDSLTGRVYLSYKHTELK